MDGIVLIVIILLAFIYFKNIMRFVYFMAVIDLVLRVMNFFYRNFSIDIGASFLPSSIEAAFSMFFSGFLRTVLIYGLNFGYVVMIYYLLKTIFKK